MNRALKIVHIVSIFIGGFFLSEYLKIEPKPLVRVLIIILGFTSLYYCKEHKYNIIVTLFSVLLGFFIILGYHMHVENQYSGTIETEYITDYSFLDFFAYIFILVIIRELIFLLCKLVFLAYQKIIENEKVISLKKIISCIIIDMFIILIGYAIYFVIYYPGLVVGDAFTSIAQAMNMQPLNNHHPLLFTFMLRFCFYLSGLLGQDNTFGCAIYSVMLMLYTSIGFSVFINWLHFRFNINKFVKYFLLGFYSFMPYVALYSITFWKDPWFVISLLLISVLSYELSMYKRKSNLFLVAIYFILAAFSIFIRNNGIYVIAFLSLYWFIYLILYKRNIVVFLGLSLITTVSFYITGPYFDKLGINGEKVEAYGLFLNQMARVVVYEGNMTEDQREYMNSLLPIEKYSYTYKPGCVDSIKWDPDFDNSAVSNGFLKKWIKIGVHNKRRYIEAWQFMSAGYWAVNIPFINTRVSNIRSGCPMNIDEGNAEVASWFDIDAHRGIRNETVRNWFPTDEWFLPAPWIHWGLLLIILIMVRLKKIRELSVLVPSVGVIITLLLAAPIQYWPRYCALEQFMIPLYLLLICKISVDSKKATPKNEG